MQGTGHVYSARVLQEELLHQLYRHDTGLCWQAPYNSTSGYGTWVQTSTGPLGTSCTAVTSAAWYTRAQALSGGATSMTAESVSSGYIGLTYMVHESTSNAVFGGELDGRTLRLHLNKGKPVEGEIYVVATGSSGETLLTSTEASVQAQLNSTTAVDPASVGGLTGSSASILQTTLNTFTNLWLRSTTVSMADTYGQVSSRCPSSTTAAYIALDNGKDLFSDQPSTSLQRYQTTDQSQLLLVNALHNDAYIDFISWCSVTTIILSTVATSMLILLFITTMLGTLTHLRLCLIGATVVLYGCIFVMWLIYVTTSHRSAVEDLTLQLTHAMDSLPNAALQDSLKLAKQAYQTWYFTGAPTSGDSGTSCGWVADWLMAGLGVLDSWLTELMQDFFDSSKLQTVRFGTKAGE